MLRRCFLGIVLSLAGVQSALAIKPVPPATAFVAYVVEREVKRQTARETTSIEDFLAMMTPNTAATWRAARKGPGPTTMGPILNPFFGWGVLPGHAVTFLGATMVDGDWRAARVRVDLTIRGAPAHVVVAAKVIDGRWLIDDIAYERGESFVAYQTRLAGG